MLNSKQLERLFFTVKGKFLDLNLFPSVPPSTEPHILTNQKISTRVYVFLLTFSFIILILYNSLILVTKTTNVKTPTYAQYLQLYAVYRDTLACSCTRISIDYDKFLTVNYTLHQICKSTFISQDWINFLVNLNYQGILYADDFRSVSRFGFQALSSFCQLANDTIDDELNNFYATQYVSSSVTNYEIFRTQIQANIQQFIFLTTNRFLSTQQMIRQTTQANNLFSARQTNAYLYKDPESLYINCFPNRYSDCVCSMTSLCYAPAVIFDDDGVSVLYNVPGFYAGCYVIESLLHSNLECLYNEECLNMIKYYVNSTLTTNITTLNRLLSTRYRMNTSIEEIFNELLVEQWNSSIMFEDYYEECKPYLCSYSIQSRNDVVYIVTTVIGTLGGLGTVLKFIVPKLVKLYRKCFCRKTRKIRPILSFVDNAQ